MSAESVRAALEETLLLKAQDLAERISDALSYTDPDFDHIDELMYALKLTVHQLQDLVDL